MVKNEKVVKAITFDKIVLEKLEETTPNVSKFVNDKLKDIVFDDVKYYSFLKKEEYRKYKQAEFNIKELSKKN